MQCLSFAGHQREGRSGEPGLPSNLLPAAVETKSRTIIITVSLPGVPRCLRSERQQQRWGGWLGSQPLLRVPGGKEWAERAPSLLGDTGPQTFPMGCVRCLGKRSKALVSPSLGVSLVPCLLHAPAKCTHWLQIITHVAKPEQEGGSHLSALPPHQILAFCLIPGEQLGLSHCLEQEPECSCHAWS